MPNKVELDSKKIILIALVSVMALYVDYNFIIKQQLASLKRMDKNISDKAKEIANLNQELATMQREPKVKPEGAAKVKKIIASEEKTNLLQEIADIANARKVTIVHIKPIQVVQDSKAAKPTAKTVLDANKFAPLTISLDILGDYHRIGSFINDLENSENFLSVESLKIVIIPDDYSQQKASLLLKTYVKK